MARPTKWSKARQQRICKRISEGARPEVAAGLEDVAPMTFYEWQERGRLAEEPYAGFRGAVTRALQEWEDASVKIVQKGDTTGGFGPAKARLELLSRRLPRLYAQQVKHHVETIEREFMSAVREACADDGLRARVCETQDLGLVVWAVCEILARRDSEGDAVRAPGGPAPAPSGAEAGPATGTGPVH